MRLGLDFGLFTVAIILVAYYVFLKGTDLLTGTGAIVLAGQLDDLRGVMKGLVIEAKRSKTGLLLSPESGLDGELVGARIPRGLLGRTPAGRGLACFDGEVVVVQVPLMTASELGRS